MTYRRLNEIPNHKLENEKKLKINQKLVATKSFESKNWKS